MDAQAKYREDAFIARWVAGELSPDENEQFQKWVEANPAEKQYFDELKTIWLDYGSIKLAQGRSTQERWQELSHRLYLTPEPFSRSRPRTGFWKWSVMAAAAAVLIGSFSLWNRFQVQTISSPRGERISASLPDGSQVHLNAETTLTFKKSGWQSERSVRLVGEAFFEIVTATAPFTVTTDVATTSVLGTSFNVKSRNRIVEVACVTGKVGVTSTARSQEPVILTPGLASLIVGNDLPSAPFVFEADEKTAWRRGELHFRSSPLKVVLDEIERQFGIAIRLETKVQDADFTGRIKIADPMQALEIVCLTSGLSYRAVDDSTFVIY